jgi:hypothetical protein
MGGQTKQIIEGQDQIIVGDYKIDYLKELLLHILATVVKSTRVKEQRGD